MKIVTNASIWDYDGVVDAICIPTNGVVRKRLAVCGAGVAKQAQRRYKFFSYRLGNSILMRGNVPYPIVPGIGMTAICSFPTKDDWKDPSTLELIEKSCIEIVALADRAGWKSIVLPTPGCGCGGLSWASVLPIMIKHLDDRFTVVLKKW